MLRHHSVMFCLLYKFEVKPERENEFREGWHLMSKRLVETSGSLGARLHRASDGSWISYAQWPDREKWIKGDDVISHFLKTTNWKECLAGEIELLMQLDVTDDLLISSCDSELK